MGRVALTRCAPGVAIPPLLRGRAEAAAAAWQARRCSSSTPLDVLRTRMAGEPHDGQLSLAVVRAVFVGSAARAR